MNVLQMKEVLMNFKKKHKNGYTKLEIRNLCKKVGVELSNVNMLLGAAKTWYDEHRMLVTDRTQVDNAIYRALKLKHEIS